MKKVIVSDISRVPESRIGELKMELEKFIQNRTLSGFLLQELLNRRDSIMWDGEIGPEEKVGHLKQITELTDLLSGAGIRFLQANLEKRQVTAKVQKPPRQLKEEVLK